MPYLLTLRQHYMQTGSGSNLKRSERSWTNFELLYHPTRTWRTWARLFSHPKLKHGSSWRKGRTHIRPLFSPGNAK
jgi:hypothetical protein